MLTGASAISRQWLLKPTAKGTTRIQSRISEGSGGGASGGAAVSCPNNPSLILLGAKLFTLAINQWWGLNKAPRGDATLSDFPQKIGLALQLGAKQA